MNVYEHIILTKKRANSKKWEIARREYSDKLLPFEDTPKQQLQSYCYHNAESIEQVKQFNLTHSLIIIAVLGQNLKIKPINMVQLLKDSPTAHICSVTGKRTVVANYYNPQENVVNL